MGEINFSPNAHNASPPCTRAKLFVVVCGLPGSGNRLLEGLFKAAGAESYVRHGYDGENPFRLLLDKHKHDTRAVMPVRDDHSNRKSNPWTHEENVRDRCIATTCRVMDGRRIPLRMVSYESLFLYPERSKNALLDWAGLPIVDWPNCPRDENSKHHEIGD